MTLSPGYTGPTSGRMTIGPNGVTHRETFTRETDPPLTHDELIATEEFRALGPNAQIREVRVLKWNLAESERREAEWRASVKRQDAELRVLRGKVAAMTPDGFTIPKGAADVIHHAASHGWNIGRAWRTVDDGARLDIVVRHGMYEFQLSWFCEREGGGRMVRRGLARGPRRPWHDAPSLTRIKEIITEVSGAE